MSRLGRSNSNIGISSESETAISSLHINFTLFIVTRLVIYFTQTYNDFDPFVKISLQ